MRLKCVRLLLVASTFQIRFKTLAIKILESHTDVIQFMAFSFAAGSKMNFHQRYLSAKPVFGDYKFGFRF
jgi:hypothetical protein